MGHVLKQAKDTWINKIHRGPTLMELVFSKVCADEPLSVNWLNHIKDKINIHNQIILHGIKCKGYVFALCIIQYDCFQNLKYFF